MIYRIEVRIRTPIHDTELPDRVATAVGNVFPNAEIEINDDELVATTHSLDQLSELLHRREILDTARSEFHHNQRPDGFSFTIKKQPAVEGIVTFAVGEPSELGEIDVDVRVMEPDVEAVIDHVAPPTVDGVPITRTDDQ